MSNESHVSFWRSRGIDCSESAYRSNYGSDRVHEHYDSFNAHDNHRPYDNVRSQILPERGVSLRARPTLVRSETFGGSLCLPTGEVLRTNLAGFELLRRLSKLRLTGGTISRSDRNALSQLADTWDWLDPECPVRVVGGNEAADGWLSAPDTLYLYPSLQCNLESICNKCYVSFQNPRYRGKALSLEVIKRVLADLADLGLFHLIVLGGEPMAHRDFFPILERGRDHGFVLSTSTNGTLLTPKRAEQLACLMDRVQVSLDGPSATLSELLKGKGTHRKTLQGIDHLRAHPITVILSYVMTPQNASLESIREFLLFAQSREIRNVNLLQYYPSGDHADWGKVLGWDQNRELRRGLWQLVSEFPDISISAETSFGFLERQPRNVLGKQAASLGCDCGRRRVSVYPNGDVVPCDFLAQDNAFVAGNVHDLDIGTIWRKSPVLRAFRERSGESFMPCAECSHRGQCLAGCAAMAWRANGKTESPDPRCPQVSGKSATEGASGLGATSQARVPGAELARPVLDARVRSYSSVGFKLFTFDRVFEEEHASRLRDCLKIVSWQRAHRDFYDQYEGDFLAGAAEAAHVAVERLAELVGYLTGHVISGPVTATAHRLVPGQAIGIHNDANPRGETFRCVVGLSSDGVEPSGGTLEFVSSDGVVIESACRRFNTGCLFEMNDLSWHRVTGVTNGARDTLVVTLCTEPGTVREPRPAPVVSTRDVASARRTARRHGIPLSTFDLPYQVEEWATAEVLLAQHGPLYNAPTTLRYGPVDRNTDLFGRQPKGSDEARTLALQGLDFLTLPILVRDVTGRLGVADGSHRLSFLAERSLPVVAAVFQAPDAWQVRLGF